MITLINFFSLLVFLLTIASFLKKYWWGFTVATFFRLQYVVLSLLCLFGSFWFGLLHLIILNAITLGVNINLVISWLPKRYKCDCDVFEIASINTWKENKHRDKLESYIETHKPEILLLMEVTDEMKKECASIFAQYPYSLSHYVRDGFEIWLLSKQELKDTDILEVGCSDTPLLSAKIHFHGHDYRIFSAHPRPAINKKYYTARQTYFREFANIINQETLPVIALGDFNSVPWERHFENFLLKTQLKSTMFTCGYRITWPRYFWLAGVPMDHILVSKSVKTGGIKVGPNVGSDHYPVAISLTS